MATDINQVIADSQAIENETLAGENTATRVGTNLVDLGENIQEDQTAIAGNTSAIQQNATDIQTNSSGIQQNATDIANINNQQYKQQQGWAYYKDGLASIPSLSIGTTYTKITIDGLNANSNSQYLPTNGLGQQLWDTVNNKITPINVGDSYTIRMDLLISAKSGNPNLIELALDIGGGATPTIIILDRSVSGVKNAPFDLSFGTPVFCLQTFKDNGGQIFAKTDTGSVTITSRGISIFRISDGSL